MKLNENEIVLLKEALSYLVSLEQSEISTFNSYLNWERQRKRPNEEVVNMNEELIIKHQVKIKELNDLKSKLDKLLDDNLDD